jgi:hypothetical protein
MKTSPTRRTFLYILISIGFAGLHCDATVYYSDGSVASVQGLQNAALNGDTIILPAGNFNWDSQISITKAITVQGAGPGATNITSSCTGGQAVSIACVPGQTTIIRDFTISNSISSNCFFYVTGSGIRQYHFTNLSFSGSGGNGLYTIWISSPGDPTQGQGAYGVIDSCTWSGGRSGLFVRDNPNANPNSWNRPMSFGTEQAVYVEDCTFSAVSQFPNANVAMDGDNGCRIVFRHNQLQDYCVGTHGADSSGPINSALQHEIMHNVFTVTDQVSQAFCIQFRGGTGAVFDNTMNALGSGGYNNLLVLEYYRASAGGGGVCQQDRFYPQDYVGTQQPGSGYRIPGQDPHYPSAPWGSVPVYDWSNHINAPLWFTEVGVGLDSQAALFMQQGRDYFVGIPKPGYTELAYPHPLRNGGPTPTPTPTATFTPTSTPARSATPTATPTATSTPTATARPTPTVTPTSTPTATPTSTPSAGLIAAYNFNEGNGTVVNDASGNDITGNVIGATWTTAGKNGNALSFNGSSSYVDLGNPALLQTTGSMTWSAWVKATANPADDGQIMAKSNDTSGWQLKTTPDTGRQTFGVVISDATGHIQRYSTTVRLLNVWYYVAGVYNAAARRLDIYVNGMLDNGTLTGTIPASQINAPVNTYVAKRISTYGGGYRFAGIIDNVRIYSRALSQAEIQADMNTPVRSAP